MNRAQHLILVAAAVMGLLALGALMDGPSDMEVERMTAADLQDAVAQARHDAPEVRLETARLDAERIEPPPAALLQRYALLGDAK
jgi:hypothetical protein